MSSLTSGSDTKKQVIDQQKQKSNHNTNDREARNIPPDNTSFQQQQHHHHHVEEDNNIDNDNDEDECWDDAKQESENELFMTAVNNNVDLQLSQQLQQNVTLSALSSKLLEPDDVTLHEAIFNNDSNSIDRIFSLSPEVCKQLVNKKDKHGNTPLHLACMLGRSEQLVAKLLQYGATVDSKNLQRWTPFHEACSYGNRDVIKLVTKQLNDDVHDVINRNKLSENLAKTRNYRLVLRWEFQSWVPFIARMLPNDVCVINKQGKYIRIDTKLLDIETLWKRGDSCLIYSHKLEKRWVIMNNKTRKYQYFEPQLLEKDIETKVDEFMSGDILDFEIKASEVKLTRSTVGWIWKAEKVEKIGKYNTALYNFNNVFLVTRKRREHLNDEDLKRNKLCFKAAVHVMKSGKRPNFKDLEGSVNGQSIDSNDTSNDDSRSENWRDAEDSEEQQHRPSLPAPQPTKVTWAQYYQAKPGEFPILGREHKSKVVKTALKASVAMSDEFPISKSEFIDLLSVVPLKLFKKLKEFIELRLPEGFPVRLDIPVFHFLTARITFEDFTFTDGPIDETMFEIPSNYEEDPNLFPMLSGRMKGHNLS